MEITLNGFTSYPSGAKRIYTLASQIIRYHRELLDQINGKEICELRGDTRSMILYGLQSNGTISIPVKPTYYS